MSNGDQLLSSVSIVVERSENQSKTNITFFVNLNSFFACEYFIAPHRPFVPGRCLRDGLGRCFRDDQSEQLVGKCIKRLLGHGSDQGLTIAQFRPSEQDVVSCLMAWHGTDNTSKDLPKDNGLLLTHEATIGQTKSWRENSIPVWIRLLRSACFFKRNMLETYPDFKQMCSPIISL